MTTEQLELISTEPTVMHGQAVHAGTRVPLSVILDCLAAGMTAGEIIAEYPVVTAAGVRAAAYGAALAREELRRCRTPGEVQADENLQDQSKSQAVVLGNLALAYIRLGHSTRRSPG